MSNNPTQNFRILNKALLKSNFIKIDLEGKSIKLEEAIVFKNISNLEIKNGNIFLEGKELTGLTFINSKNIKISNVQFDFKKSGIGFLRFNKCQEVLVEGCSFLNLGGGKNNVNALVYKGCTNLHIKENLFDAIVGKKVSRAIKQSDRIDNLSNDCVIENNQINNIFPIADGDGIYIESPNEKGLKDQFHLAIIGNRFVNNAKRFIKINASNVFVKGNIGKSDLKSMYSFISVFGNNIVIEENVFEAKNTYLAIGIGTNKNIENITIKKNRLTTKSKKVKTKGVSMHSNCKDIVIQDNYIIGFHFPVTTSFKNNNSLENITLENNYVVDNSACFLNLTGSHQNIIIKENTLESTTNTSMHNISKGKSPTIQVIKNKKVKRKQ